MRLTIRLISLLFVCLVIGSSTMAQKLEVDVAVERTTGNKIRGPATIKLKNLNVLRYDIEVGVNVTFKDGPSLQLPFIPPIPSGESEEARLQDDKKTTDTKPETAAPGPSLNDDFRRLVDRLITYEKDWVAIQNDISRSINLMNDTSRETLNLVAASDAILKTGGVQSIITDVGRILTHMDAVLLLSWPDERINTLIGDLNILKDELNTLSTKDPAQWALWYPENKSSFDDVIKRIGEIQTEARALDSTSERGRDFSKAKSSLGAWRGIFAGVKAGGVESFTRTFRVGCDFSFDQTKESKVEVVRRDRLPRSQADGDNQDDDGGDDSDTEESRIEIVTVVCSSPLTISGGFGFSTIDETEFAFAPSTKTVIDEMGEPMEVNINRFALKNRSSFRAIPVLLLNTRFWEPNDTFAAHVSAGAAVDIKTGEAGTDLEFIVGPSFSFKRTLFVTPGLHIGRVPKLIGFEEGDEVPDGVSEPPLEKAWKKGFVVTFTFKLR